MLKFKKLLYLEGDAFDHVELKVLSVKLNLILAFAFLNFLRTWFRLVLTKVNHFNEDTFTAVEDRFGVVEQF